MPTLATIAKPGRDSCVGPLRHRFANPLFPFVVPCAAAITLLLPSAAFAEDYYVSVRGSDSNPGTSEQPFRTPQKAANIVEPGDTVFIETGTYGDDTGNGRIINLKRSGAAGKMITFRNRPGHSPVIADSSAAFGLISAGADYIRVEGLEFGVVRDSCVYIASNKTDGSHNWEVVGNLLHHCGVAPASCTEQDGRAGVGINAYSGNILIDSNTIHTVGRLRDTSCDDLPENKNDLYRHDHGVYAKGKNIRIQNNEIYGTHAGYGVKIDGYNRSLGALKDGEFSHIIINNTIGPNVNPNPYNTMSGAAARPWNSTPDSYDPRWLVKNNIFLDQGRSLSAVMLSDTSSSNVPGQHVCENNLAEYTGNLRSMCTTHIDAIKANITERNNRIDVREMGLVSDTDRRLVADSPAIAYGDPDLAPSWDKDGNPRAIIDGRIDAGAYSISSAASPAARPNPPVLEVGSAD